jgi:mono/diheme cytochrome c family protein
MDDDFSVMAILPPYNTVLAQIVVGTNGTARRVDGTGGVQVNYRAVLDSDGSINTTSIGKGNFWDYVYPMLGAALAPDQGLELLGASPGAWMPGPANTPKPMYFENGPGWFVAWGVPITPYDDDLQLNPYPLMHVSTSGHGFTSASTDIVLPVSLETNCRLCHASGAGLAARPDPDWEWNPIPAQDYRFNILRLHDQIRFQAMPAAYSNVLAAAGYNTQGLYASVVKSGRPILCAICHLSEAVPGSGQPGLPPLTEAVHGLHAGVTDPATGQLLGNALNRAACYRCHPGAETRCLRGAMGRAVDITGQLAIQCQDCHGPMAPVASTNRTGWLNEPNCQACHTGDAVSNNGQIRYDNALVTNYQLRVAVNSRFATNPNAPLPGTSLFRFSKGHGGLYCSA